MMKLLSIFSDKPSTQTTLAGDDAQPSSVTVLRKDDDRISVNAADNYESADQEDLQPSPRVRDFRNFHGEFRKLIEGVEGLSEAIARARSGMHEAGTFMPTIEAEFYRTSILSNDNEQLAEKLLEREHAIKKVEAALSDKADLIETMRDREAELSTELEAVRKRGTELGDRLQEAEDQLRRVKAELEEMTAANQEFTASSRSVEREFEMLKEKHAVLTTDLNKSLKNEGEIRRKHDEVANRFESEKRLFQAMAKENEVAKQEIARFRKERTELKSRLDAVILAKERIEADAKENAARLESEVYAQRSENSNMESRLRVAEQTEKYMLGKIEESKREVQQAEAARVSAQSELDTAFHELSALKRELSTKTTTLSEVNLKYMSDLMGQDYLKKQYDELSSSYKTIAKENQQLVQYQAMYKVAEQQIADLQRKLKALSHGEAAPVSPAVEEPGEDVVKH